MSVATLDTTWEEVAAARRRHELLERLRELRQQRTRTLGSRFRRYRDRPHDFIEEVLGGYLWSKPAEIVSSVWGNRYTAVHAAHDVSKSWTAARIAATWLSVYEPGEAFVVSTAPTFAQVRAILWREIGRAHGAGRLPGRVNQTEWWIGDEIVGFGRKPADWNPAAFQGIHARRVLVVIDEACGVPGVLFDAVDALVTNDDCRVLAIGNPDDPTAFFAKVCRPNSGWNVIHVDGLDSPNFTGEYVPDDVRPLLLSPTWVEERVARWGEDSPLYESKVRGIFPEVAEGVLIPLAWVEAARRRWTEWHEARDEAAAMPAGKRKPEHTAALERFAAGHVLGVDVARGGGDDTVIAVRHGAMVRIGYSSAEVADTMRVAGQVRKMARELVPGRIGVDVIGVGAGVFDRLAEQGEPVEPLNSSWGATEFDPRGEPMYAGIRSQWWWTVRELFDPAQIERTGEGLAIDPDDEELADQLSTMRYAIDSRGRIVVESKADMRDRGVDSPDRADALMYTIARAPDDGEGVVVVDEREDFQISPY